MTQVAKVSFHPVLFLSLAAFLAYSEVFPIGACTLAWMGGIQICNWAAPRFAFARLIHWIHAMTFELFALLGVALLRLIPVKQTAKGEGRPILLIHGYLNHSSVWFLFKRRLKQLKGGPIYTINLGHPFRSIRTYAAKIKAKAEEIAGETGRKDLILIGHSMGGLVASYYAALIADPNTVTDVITIGTPLHGTPVARMGLGPNAREMAPNSTLLQEMREAMKQRKEIRFHHLATKSDQLVIPGISAVIPENNHFVFEDLGHASLLYSNRVAGKIAQWLNQN